MLVSIDKERVKLALTKFTHSITIAVVIGGDVSYDFMSEGSFRPPLHSKPPMGSSSGLSPQTQTQLMYR